MKKLLLKISEYKLVFISVVFLVIFSVGCAKTEEKEIKIGAILPLTGDLADPGSKSINAIKLVIDEYNSSKPKMPIKLFVEDSKANPVDGVNAIRKLINVNNIKLIIGDITSGVTLAIAPIAEKEHVVVLAPGASNPKVREAGDYIFRNWASDSFDGEVMAKYLTRRLGKKRAAVIYVNNDYGYGLANAFEKTFVEYGGLVILKENYEQGSSDFRNILTKMREANSDCVYLPGHPRENGILVRQLREMRINTTISANLSVETPDFYNLAKEAGDGVFFSTPAFDLSSNEQNIKKFIEDYQSKYSSKPDATAGHSYDAANIMLQAIRMADYDISKVKDQLYIIKDYPGVTGNTTLDDHGDVVKPVMIKKLNKDGSSIIIETYKP